MKNKVLSKMIRILLVITMVCGLVACSNKNGGSESKESQKKTESPATVDNINAAENNDSEEITYPLNTKDTLTLWHNNQLNPQSEYANYSQSPFHAGLAEMTGVEVEWQQPAQGTAGIADPTAYNLLLTEEVLPDIIFTSMSAADGQQLIDDGVIYDLTEYLPKYAPDYWKYINREEYAADLQAMKTELGSLFNVGQFVEEDYNITYTGPVIRQDWLDECGLEAPVTMEEWENVLKIFKEKYGATFGWFYKRFENPGIGSGVGAYGTFNAITYVNDGTVQFAQAQPEFKKYMEYLHKWYQEGLIDKDSVTMDDAAVRTKVLNNEIGVSFTALSQLSAWVGDATAEGTGANWVGLGYPRTAKGEATCYIQTRASGYQNWGSVVTTSCPEEKLVTALKWLNYGYTEEGLMYWNYGKEGVSYTLGSDGLPQWTELVTSDPAGISEAVKKYTGVGGTGISVQQAHYVKSKNVEAAAEAVYTWTDNSKAREHALPGISMTEEESIKYNDKMTAIAAYVQEMSFQFMTGDASLNNYDAYLSELNKLGLQECLEIAQAAYNRYISR